MSDRVLLCVVLLIVVPVVTGLPAGRLYAPDPFLLNLVPLSVTWHTSKTKTRTGRAWGDYMSWWALGIALKGFGAFVLLLMAWPVKVLVQRKMKDGKLKRLLLRRIN